MSNAAQFWINSSFPFSNIALEILSVPASSAPVERLFSRAGIIMSPLRTRLTMGCGTPGPRGPGTHKVFGRNFTMGGHPQSFGRKSKRKWKF